MACTEAQNLQIAYENQAGNTTVANFNMQCLINQTNPPAGMNSAGATPAMTAGFAWNMFTGYLARVPTNDESLYWSNLLYNQQATAAGIKGTFENCQERKNRYPGCLS